MRIAIAIPGFLMLSISAMAFFVPLTTEQRVAGSNLIAVVEATKVDDDKGHSIATVIQPILGTKTGEKIEIWDDWQVERDGTESRIAGRDPNLKVGKRYLIYLVKNARGRLVTVQSSLDCLEIIGEKVQKEGIEGFEPLADKLTRISDIVAKQNQGKKAAPGQPATGSLTK